MPDVILEVVLENAKEFYKVEKKNLLVAKYQETNCFSMKCYDTECGCDCTDSCDLEVGETIKSVYPTAVEIDKEEFTRLWKECQKK